MLFYKSSAGWNPIDEGQRALRVSDWKPAGEADLHWPLTKIMWCHFIEIKGLFKTAALNSGQEMCSVKENRHSVAPGIPPLPPSPRGLKPCLPGWFMETLKATRHSVCCSLQPGMYHLITYEMACTVNALKFRWTTFFFFYLSGRIRSLEGKRFCTFNTISDFPIGSVCFLFIAGTVKIIWM